MLRLASSLGLLVTVANIKQRIRHIAVRGAIGVVGLAVLLFAICFLLGAAYLWIAVLLDPIASAAIMGGALLVIALILFFLASRSPPPQPNPADQAREALRESAARFSEALGGTAGRPPANPVMLAAGLALVVGVLLGRRAKRDPEDE